MAREQRRLAAIVSTDVAGYSRLMGRDESGTLAALKTLRRELVDPGIAAHGGRIVKTTGDGLLLEFSSVVDAVRCAVEMQTAMASKVADVPEDRRITFRVGVNIGDIIIDGDDIFGDGVNIAARLQEIAPPGGVCVSSRVHDDVRDRLDIAFVEGGAKALKNIVRHVEVWNWSPGAFAPAATPASTQAPLALPEKPSIAILPFDNMSGDPEQEYFADGMVEDIITALSRFRELFVIARNSSFAYKGKPIDIKQVGRDLGVRYVLEGSVRKAGGSVRITGQLIDSETGAHVWAGRFDGSLEDVFDLQDRVATGIVGELMPQLQLAEMERAKRKPTANLDAYDCYLRGLVNTYLWTKTSNEQALQLFYKAIELDEGFAAAHAQAGLCYALRKQSGWMINAELECAEATRLSRKAIELGSDDDRVLVTSGFNLAFIGAELDAAAEFIQRGLVINPNLALGWHFSGWVKIYLGDHETGLDHLDRSLRLSPRDPIIVLHTTMAEALAYICTGRYEETVRRSGKVVAQVPTFIPAWRLLAIGNALCGRLDDARQAAARVKELELPTAGMFAPVTSPPMRRAQDRDRLREGLRLAGLVK